MGGIPFGGCMVNENSTSGACKMYLYENALNEWDFKLGIYKSWKICKFNAYKTHPCTHEQFAYIHINSASQSNFFFYISTNQSTQSPFTIIK